MAGVGEASAIAGLFSLGIQVTTALYAVADGIGSAGEEVRSVARDVDSATQIMKTIQGVLDKQSQINDEINGIVKRIMDICHQIFKIYDVLQKSLVPLMERFRDSERKLEQFGLRLKWYFRSKEKVSRCRHSLQQQIAMLTPVLTLLSIDRSGTAQNNYYVQNIQVKYILENSTANLQHGIRNERRQRVSTDSSHSTLLPSCGDTSRGRPESKTTSATTETSNNQTSLVRYHSSNNNSENLPEEEIGQQVEEALDTGLDVVSNQDIEIITVETYSVEMQFSRVVKQMLGDLGNKNIQSSSENRSPSPVRVKTPKSTTPDQEEKWTKIYKPDGTSTYYPLDTIDTTKKFLVALLELGYDVIEAFNDFPLDPFTMYEEIEGFRFDSDSYSIFPNALEHVLEKNHIRITDSDGSDMVPRLWERYTKQARTIYLKSTRPDPAAEKKVTSDIKRGLFSRLKRLLRG
ncbi:hypothetical protein F5Y02DRAFT_394804 [Annulohypoxylon stygium]|nr:hypothetical protein F5Y02DRAFT_394804 [Annulohypoxylon stygium]